MDYFLGIETSCDDTAVAVVARGLGGAMTISSSRIASQDAAHSPFGGVVPEVASREHSLHLDRLCQAALADAGISLKQISAIAVTRGPGLIGALLVGLQYAKGLAAGSGIPWIGVNHLEGHLLACQLEEAPPDLPHLALLASGGHTQLIGVDAPGKYTKIAGTLDDAAGEAFDKVAKLLGLGHPGGPAIDRLAKKGDLDAFCFPRALPEKKNLNFSFSGLKTAVAVQIKKKRPTTEKEVADYCASAQEAICDVLTKKAVRAALRHGYPAIVAGGGVAANSRLRELLKQRCQRAGLRYHLPRRELCTDNAAMIAVAGIRLFECGYHSKMETPPKSRWLLEMCQQEWESEVTE